MNEEIWKDVEGMEGRYAISSHGRVKGIRVPFVKPCHGTKGYLQVSLNLLPRGLKTFKIHRLVSDAFLRKLLPGESVHHKDNDKLNNSVENLEIISITENTQRAWKDGLMQPVVDYNKAHPRPIKLTAEQVLEIRAYPDGMNGILGPMYGVHRMTIGEIRRREIWKHI